MPLWTPDLFPDARCWLDASDSATLTLSGSSVTNWDDKIGTNDANDAVDASNNKITTARPTVATAAQNGLNAINFNGSQWFDHNTARGMLRNRSHAILAVAMKYGVVNNGVLQFAMANRRTGDAQPFAFRFQLTHRDVNSFAGLSRRLDNDATTTFQDTGNNPPYNTDWHVHVVSCNWGGGDFEYWIDGIQVGTTQTYPGIAGNTSDTDLDTTPGTWTAIGNARRDGAPSLPLSSGSRIGEIVCGAKSSGSYSASDRQILEGALLWKWGLQANLPSDHPYKNGAPRYGEGRRQRYAGGYGL